ncbi:MAG: adenylate/guanylate cyclase domain-containing protein [Methylobacteriaceae bacterium]|nr:adenylate/guanylate cyclase domain-containing protein [Methylobacteriaceae bacterium]
MGDNSPVVQIPQRRLAAILAADITGYSRLMGQDEAATVRDLKAHQAVVLPMVAEHDGSIIDTAGDGILAQFSSVVRAVECAIAIQRIMTERNLDVPEDRRMRFRIGVNLGDIIDDGTRLYGDGVNIAARIESLCDPGGVFLSWAAAEQVRDKLPIQLESRGSHAVKNIARPIEVFRVLAEAHGPVRAEARVGQLAPPEKPSIAVLAFQNMSGDQEQEYFADGIAEDIITDLSKIGGLLVIARNSSFAYKNKAVDIRTVARELGVRSVLEGSVRRVGGRVRITAQLIDAESGGHLWAERFDRNVSDIFAVQDEVTQRIVDALKIKLTPGEAALLGEGGTTNSKAHDFFLLGRSLLFSSSRNRQMFARATTLFEQAIAEDPNYGDALAGAAMAHCLNWQNHWTDDWSRSLEESKRLVELAVAKNPRIAFVHYVAAITFIWAGDHDRSEAEIYAALHLNPNYAPALGMLGFGKIYGREPLAAIPHIEQAIRLDPVFKQQYIHFLGSAYLIAGEFEAAAAQFRERIRLNPKTDLSRALLAVALGHLGEAEKARGIWRELVEINPKYSFADHVGRLPFRHPADADRLTEGLRKAGIL